MRSPLSLVLTLLAIGALGQMMGCAPTVISTETQSLMSPEAKNLPTDSVQLTTIAEGLENPWGMAWLPNGDILITERPGRLRIIRDGKLDPEAIAGVAAVSNVTAQQLFASRQGGLLDVALHPRFTENRWLYFSYAQGTQDANRTQVARAKFDGNALSDWEVVFEVAQTKQGGQHFGSRLLWLPDRTLLISTGDGGNPPLKLDGDFIRQQAQNRASHLGKVIRINDDGTVPPDNPLVNDPDATPEVWSYGHRNIQGMAFDPITQRVWATEHGSRGGDELNIVEAGRNYGWPVVSFSAEYSTGRPVAPQVSRADVTNPKRVWTPAIAPSGLAVYTGDRYPEWQGNIFAGGLVSKDIRRLMLDGQGHVRSESKIPIGQRVRDIRQGPDGQIYVLTDETAGQLLTIKPAPE